MESKKNINQLVEETLDGASSIGVAKTPPFFKEKMLNRMTQAAVEKVENVQYLNWFTPKYQAVALICFIVLNTIALLSYTPDNYNEDVINFAEAYGLSETDTNFYMNQN